MLAQQYMFTGAEIKTLHMKSIKGLKTRTAVEILSGLKSTTVAFMSLSLRICFPVLTGKKPGEPLDNYTHHPIYKCLKCRMRSKQSRKQIIKPWLLGAFSTLHGRWKESVSLFKMEDAHQSYSWKFKCARKESSSKPYFTQNRKQLSTLHWVRRGFTFLVDPQVNDLYR